MRERIERSNKLQLLNIVGGGLKKDDADMIHSPLFAAQAQDLPTQTHTYTQKKE
jgi:hypothetical protein